MDFFLLAILQALCFGPLVLGLYLSMTIFRLPDITTDGSYTLGAVITALGLTHHWPVGWTILLAMAGGAIAGSLTAWIHTRLRIQALLAGILTMTALYSVNLSLMGRSNIPLLGLDNLFSLIQVFDIPDYNALFTLLLGLGLLLILKALLLKSDFGIAMRATGDRESMVEALGVNTHWMKCYGLAISNGLVALSGSLMTQFQGFADINMGIGIVISGLGAVIIGESLISITRTRSIWRALLFVIIGAIIFQLVLALTLKLGVDASLLKLVTALLVLGIVALPQWKVFSKLSGL